MKSAIFWMIRTLLKTGFVGLTLALVWSGATGVRAQTSGVPIVGDTDLRSGAEPDANDFRNAQSSATGDGQTGIAEPNRDAGAFAPRIAEVEVPPPPLSQPVNRTRQLDAPPPSALPRSQRPGASIPERVDPRVQEPVGQLPPPPVYELSQAATDDAPEETGALPDLDDDGLGITLGAFRLFPVLELRGGATTNASGSGVGGDTTPFTRIAPQVRLESLWSRHFLEADLRGTYARYTDSPDTDDRSFTGVLRGRIDVTRQTDIEIEGQYDILELQRGETGAPGTVSERPYLHTRAISATLNHRFNRLRLRLRGGVTQFDYQNATNRDGTTVDNGDLDYRVEDVSLRGTYEYSPKTEVFGEVFADRELYDRKADSGGFRQGSEGYGGRAGLVWRPSPLVELNGSIGAEAREPNDPSSGRISAVLLEGGVLWRPVSGLDVDLQLRQSLETSNENGVSDGVIVREADLQLTYALRPSITLTGGLLYGQDTYQGSAREDERLTASAGARYQFNRYVAFVADIIHDRVMSNIAGESDEETELSAGLSLRY